MFLKKCYNLSSQVSNPKFTINETKSEFDWIKILGQLLMLIWFSSLSFILLPLFAHLLYPSLSGPQTFMWTKLLGPYFPKVELFIKTLNRFPFTFFTKLQESSIQGVATSYLSCFLKALTLVIKFYVKAYNILTKINNHGNATYECMFRLQ